MKRKRILIAVDSPSGIEKLRELLASSGYEVRIAADGAEALSLSREFRPHLIFSELNLAKIDGHHLLREIKGHPETKHMSFMVMSKHCSVDERVHTISLGVDDYITIPFDVHEVLIRIQIILGEAEIVDTLPKRQQQGFSGKLSDMDVIEILQTLEIAKKTGVLRISCDYDEGSIVIKDGEITQIVLGRLSPKQALFRMFTWSDGSFRFETRPVDHAEKFDERTAVLLKQGLIYKDRWEKICKDLPPLQTPIKIDPGAQAVQTSEEEQSVLKIANGNTKMVDLIQSSKLDDLKALLIISKLFKKGMIKENTSDAQASDQNGGVSNRMKNGVTNTRISRLVGSFLNPVKQSRVQTEENGFAKNGISSFQKSVTPEESLSGETVKRQSLNKSELLIIREKLANDRKW